MSWDTPQSVFVSLVESGKRRGEICVGTVELYPRGVSVIRMPVCFPETRADINNVAGWLCAGLLRNADAERAKLGSEAPGSRRSL